MMILILMIYINYCNLRIRIFYNKQMINKYKQVIPNLAISITLIRSNKLSLKHNKFKNQIKIIEEIIVYHLHILNLNLIKQTYKIVNNSYLWT